MGKGDLGVKAIWDVRRRKRYEMAIFDPFESSEHSSEQKNDGWFKAREEENHEQEG